MAVLLDSYSESNHDGTSIVICNVQPGGGQTFKPSSSAALRRAVFYLKKLGSPTGNATAKVYAHTGTYGTSGLPTGAALATSDTLDVSTLTTLYALKTFSFSGENVISLVGDTPYVVTVEYSGGDISNRIEIGADSGGTAAGNAVSTSDGSSWIYGGWQGPPATDCCFYVYSTSSPTVTTQAVTNVASSTATGNGNVTSDGGASVTERGVCWDISPNPTTANSNAIASGTTGAYTVPMTGLAGVTLHYARAYAINSVGTSYGEEVTFTTSGFTNSTNAYTSNDTYATTPGTTGDISIQLSGDAGVGYSTALSKTFTSTEGLQTYGLGATELWGQTWFGSNVSDSNFRVKIGVDGVYQVYKTFGFAPAAGVVLTGIEVSVEAKWVSPTTSIDHVKVKIYYGTSTTPVQAGSVAFVTDGGGDGTGAITAFNGTDWFTADDGTSTMKKIYPVGSIYISTLSTNPATLLGFGTWAAFGAGQVMVGKAASGTFATGGATGGAETITLDTTQIPSHNHTQDSHNHTQNSHNHTQDAHLHAPGGAGAFLATDNGVATAAGATYYTPASSYANTAFTIATNQATTATNIATTATNQATGGGGSHSNLQPYVVIYAWSRTA